MEKIEIFSDLINKIKENENKGYILFGDNIVSRDKKNKKQKSNLLFHLAEKSTSFYLNGKINEMKDIVSEIVPVLPYHKTFSRKLQISEHEYNITSCNLIMVGGYKDPNPRIFKIRGVDWFRSFEEVKYETVEREEFFKREGLPEGIEKKIEDKVKEINKIYC